MLLADILAQAGWSMFPLYLCSLVALAVFARKLLELRRARLSDLAWFERVLEYAKDGDFGAASAACVVSSHPGTRVVAAAARGLLVDAEVAQGEAKRVGSLEIQHAERGVGLLSFIGQAAPLLGLLGTVLGMVELFMSLQGTGLSGVDVGLLSSGIWKALLTTAAGLCIAVPVLAARSYLESRADRLRLQLSDLVQQLLFAAAISRSGKAGADDGVR